MRWSCGMDLAELLFGDQLHRVGAGLGGGAVVPLDALLHAGQLCLVGLLRLLPFLG